MNRFTKMAVAVLELKRAMKEAGLSSPLRIVINETDLEAVSTDYFTLSPMLVGGAEVACLGRMEMHGVLVESVRIADHRGYDRGRRDGEKAAKADISKWIAELTEAA